VIDGLAYSQPSNWQTIKLGDAATFINGYAFKPSDWKTEGLEIIRIQNLTKSSNSVNYYDGEINSRYKVKKGDFLISWSATLGIFEWVGDDAWLNQHLFKVVFDKKQFDKSFFKHLIAMSLEEMGKETHGSTMKHITKPRFDNFKIPYPPLAEQQKIAAILDAANSLRQKDQQLVESYTALSQSLFLEMFGDPVTNPMGWNIEAFDKLVANDCPLTYGIVQPGDELTEGTPIVRPVDLVERYVKINSLKKIAPEISQKFERTILKGGELLLSVRGSVGAISIALPELRGANVTRGIVPIWMNAEKMTNEFAINLLQSNQVQKKLKDSSKGATLVQLNLKDLREMQLISPPIVLQKTFTTRIQLIEAQKQQAQRSLEKSEALFNSLLQRAFTGELTAKMAA